MSRVLARCSLRAAAALTLTAAPICSLTAQVPRRGARMPAPREQPTVQPVPQPVVKEVIGVAMPQALAPVEIKEILALASRLVPPECEVTSPRTPDQRPRGTRPVELTAEPTATPSVVLRWRGAPWAERHDVIRLDRSQSGGGGGGGWSLFCPSNVRLELPPPDTAAAPLPTLATTTDAVRPALVGAVVGVPPPPPPLERYTHEDPFVCRGTSYQYVVVSYYADSAAARGDTAVVTTPPKLPPPPLTGLTAQNITMGALLTWEPLAQAYAYHVFRDDALIATLTPKRSAFGERLETSYIDQAPTTGTHQYEIRAILGCDYAPAISIARVSAEALEPPPVPWCRRGAR